MILVAFYVLSWLLTALVAGWGVYWLRSRTSSVWIIGAVAVSIFLLSMIGRLSPISVLRRVYILHHGTAAQAIVLDIHHHGGRRQFIKDRWATIAFDAAGRSQSVDVPIGMMRLETSQRVAVHYVPGMMRGVEFDDDKGATKVAGAVFILFAAAVLLDLFLQRRKKKRIEAMQMWPPNA